MVQPAQALRFGSRRDELDGGLLGYAVGTQILFEDELTDAAGLFIVHVCGRRRDLAQI